MRPSLGLRCADLPIGAPTAQVFGFGLAFEFGLGPGTLRQAMGAAAQANGGLAAMPDTFLLDHRDLIIQMTAQHRVPSVASRLSNRVTDPARPLPPSNTF